MKVKSIYCNVAAYCMLEISTKTVKNVVMVSYSGLVVRHLIGRLMVLYCHVVSGHRWTML